ncbi:hypothetical protein J2S57_006171 [Kineosporia succinea]|uniref:Uncharacterized protein n=1 Tax=Kineosporia succinea TaxID=84632 RepID=A0ABT9PCI1_9ACTN|nr:hypothetical protein [Kineosporia succinea]
MARESTASTATPTGPGAPVVTTASTITAAGKA